MAVGTGAKTVDRSDSPENELHPQPVGEAPIDLPTAVKRALANNNVLLQAREKLVQTGHDKRVVRSILLPNLSLAVNGTESKQPVGNLGRAPFNGDPYNTFTTDLKLTQPLMAFGSLSAIDVAEFTTQAARLDLEIAERTLTANVIQGFYRVLLNQQLLRNLEKVQKVVDESLATAINRQRTGRGQLLDVLQVKTQIALLKPQIEGARNQWEAAGSQLATYLSERGRYFLDVKGRLKALRMKDVEARLAKDEGRWPELIKVRVQTDQLAAQKHVSFGKHLPSLNLVGDLGTQAYNKADFYSSNVRLWSVSLQLMIPLFSGFSSSDEQHSLSSQQRQIDLGEHDLVNTLALNEVQSRKALESTEASLISAEEAADLANQSLNEAKRNYRLATIDFMQFLTVEQADVQADSSLDNIKFNNLVAFVNYFVARGWSLATLIDILARETP